MSTGCQPPYCHGTGGFCGCNCNCCPPPCCPIISVYFQCCPTSTSASPPTMPFGLWEDLSIAPSVPVGLPDFDTKPIFSANKNFTLGYGSIPTSCPCETVCVELKCGGITPCCCLELLDGIIYSVGNGYVTAPTTVDVAGCGTGFVYINGLPPPVFVSDCEEINVTVVLAGDGCCDTCYPIDIVCAPCPLSAMMATSQRPLVKRKTDPRTGKTKLNPNTGKPLFVVDKAELLKRIKKKILLSKRGHKN